MSEQFPDCYRIVVQSARVECLLGVYEHEQRQPRQIGVEVELFVPITEPAARNDQLAGTVNYEAVMQAIRRTAASRRFKLVESLCSSLLDDIAQLPGLRAVKVTVIKPHPMQGLESVRIEQWRVL
ncbi:MAG: dihydroneopterin aldolase [Betaproteobacteria bacterium]|nr:dihydroneopterin aldolase [Betaproteobacteria bacterium]